MSTAQFLATAIQNTPDKTTLFINLIDELCAQDSTFYYVLERHMQVLATSVAAKQIAINKATEKDSQRALLAREASKRELLRHVANAKTLMEV